MKNTWFGQLLNEIEEIDWSYKDQSMFVAYSSDRLGRKICNLWGESYDKLKAIYRERCEVE